MYGISFTRSCRAILYDLPVIVLMLRWFDVCVGVTQGQPQRSHVAEWAEESRQETLSPNSGYLTQHYLHVLV